MPRTIPLAQHIFRRLHQLNCHSIHGVPGDFFLRALDHVRPSGLNWIGNANELCAGYAADGYARTATQLNRHRGTGQKVVGAFMTTYGVGELSAINAVGGSYSENIPTVQIVGTPSQKAMRGPNSRRPIHHTLTDDRMNVYAEMAKQVTCAQALLHQTSTATDAAEAYDEVLEKAVQLSRPVYVSLASDMVELPVPEDIITKPLNIEPPLENNGKVSDRVASKIAELMKTSQSPLIIADGLSYPLCLQKGINELMSLTNIPAMSFTSGKGIIDESLASWSPSLPNTTEYSRNADLVLIFGGLLSDTNTARWSAIPNTPNKIMFNLDSVELPGDVHEAVRGKQALNAVVEKLKNEGFNTREGRVKSNLTQTSQRRPTPAFDAPILQDDLWPAMSSFLQPEDTLLFANGTPLIGGRNLHLQSGSQVVASPIWNAIGSMLPATQGIAAAKRDHHLPGRTILLEGDGSFQVTCQSVSDILRYKLDATIFIINNAGYTYERWLHGMDAEYNDIPSWRYTEAASFFGAQVNDPSYPIFTRRVETWGQLQEVLASETARDGKGLKIIDVVVDPEDVLEASKPGLLRASEALRSA